MSLLRSLRSLVHAPRILAPALRTMLRSPRLSVRDLARLPERVRAAQLTQLWDPGELSDRVDATSRQEETAPNPLRVYFDNITEGPGVWKWLHYFEVYQRHLSKFVGRAVTVVEIGVYSGGSMPMWRHYFGTNCEIHGVDIQPECKVYEAAHTTIHIGDQADHEFWRRFRGVVPDVDVLIDDGGHQAEQQMVSLEEMLPHLKAGGVYICEDVHRIHNSFAEFAHSLADGLNAFVWTGDSRVLGTRSTPFQDAISSIHFYPFMVVIEKRDAPRGGFTAPKHGTEWQPGLGRKLAKSRLTGRVFREILGRIAWLAGHPT